jgi:hypothetical protein
VLSFRLLGPGLLSFRLLMILFEVEEDEDAVVAEDDG